MLIVYVLSVLFLNARHPYALQVDPGGLNGVVNNHEAVNFPWPVFYLHVPKTAGGFATSILHSACGACVAETLKVQIAGVFDPGQCCINKFARFDGLHLPIYGPDFEALPEPRLKHVISLFRHPRQRLMSGFYHNRHNCGYLKRLEAPDCNGDDNTQPSCAPLLKPATPATLEQYAQCVGSCTYNMLTESYHLPPTGVIKGGEFCGAEKKGTFDRLAANHTAIVKNVISAQDTVRALGFVGLADEYELSVCLWHIRFGSTCLPVEFVNLRKGVNRKDSLYKEDAFTAKIDEWMTADMAIYNVAKKRFYDDLKRYGVNRVKCAKVCPEPAEIWAVDDNVTQLVTLVVPSTSQYEFDWPGRKAFDVD